MHQEDGMRREVANDVSFPRRRPITCNRSLVLDVVALCERNAFFPLEKTFELAEIAALRAAARRRISWPMLFLKAYATVAAVTPPLRQAFIRWPRPHLCEYEENVGMLAVNRKFDGEDRLCWARFVRPEQQSLVALQESLDAYQHEPVEQVFARQLKFSRLPSIVRRLIWRLNLDFSSRRRPLRIGTFTMSTLAGQGTTNRFHPTLATSSLTYGPLETAGRTLVTLICDHRVFDGALGAQVLANLEAVLYGPIADELHSIAKRDAGQFKFAA